MNTINLYFFCHKYIYVVYFFSKNSYCWGQKHLQLSLTTATVGCSKKNPQLSSASLKFVKIFNKNPWAGTPLSRNYGTRNIKNKWTIRCSFSMKFGAELLPVNLDSEQSPLGLIPSSYLEWGLLLIYINGFSFLLYLNKGRKHISIECSAKYHSFILGWGQREEKHMCYRSS